MEIVVEYSFILSFVACYLALVCASKVLKQKLRKSVLSSAFGATVSVFCPLLLPLWWVKLLVLFFSVSFCVCVSFCWQGAKMFFLEFCVTVGFTFLFGGFCAAAQNIIGQFSLFVVCLVLLFAFAVTNLVIRWVKKANAIHSFSFDLKIVDNGKEFFEEAYLDSGNVLIDKVSGKPVVLINFEVFHKLYDKVSLGSAISKTYDQSSFKNGHFLPINSVGGRGEILVFSVDELWIGKNRFVKDATLGLSFSGFEKSFGKRVLLHCDMV